ncbi:MAG: hypothetical protein Q8927_10235 [Bacteroidota bacterium]|nr:hypothetical protein [Bacteroidota bacterium]MDP4216570.1 hypothetical protein [Bacteroidota bacterium]MDP4245034.1 hypothetical protein [Bacteroidota bacterium]MDP4252869.1 hypothetical protein [Bacteroidota bacterium]MDP4259861.1 hypothetical protein [Bacteroidota bacterium]
MKTIIYGWNLMRALRLIFGIVAIGQAIFTRDWVLGLAGAFLLFMALANIGCCGAGQCKL